MNEIEKLKFLIDYHEELLLELRHKLSVAEESKKLVDENLESFDDIMNSFITNKAVPPCDL